MGSLELDRYRIPPGEIPLAGNRSEKLPRHRQGEQFLKGPIPLAWLAQAASLPGKTLAVGTLLWFEAGRSRSNSPTVKLTGRLMKRFGIGPKAARRAFEKLESAGLATIQPRRGKSPMVTILDAPTENRGQNRTESYERDGSRDSKEFNT